jgi:hypothetical protein
MGALSKIGKFFYNAEAVREENAKFKERMAEIDAKAVVQEAEMVAAKAANKEQFRKRIAEATAKRNAKIEESKQTGKVVL